MTHLSWAVFRGPITPCIAIVRAHLNFDRETWRDMVSEKVFFYSVELKHNDINCFKESLACQQFFPPQRNNTKNEFHEARVFACFKVGVVNSRLSISQAFAASQGGLHFQAQLPAQKKAHKRNMTWCILGGCERKGANWSREYQKTLQNRERFGGANAWFRLVQLYPRIVKGLCLQHTRLIILVRLIPETK